MDTVINGNNKKIEKLSREQLQLIINSPLMMLAISFMLVLCWAIDLPYISITLMLVYEICVFTICYENPKALMLPLFAISFSITSIYGVARWIFYSIIIFLFIVTLISYIVVQKVKFKKHFKKGSMFYFFILAGIGNCLGGIIGFFEFKTFLIVLAFCVLVYFFYWFFINFLSKDAYKYFAVVMIFVSLIISAELVISYIRAGMFFEVMPDKIITVGTGQINGAATFMLIGVSSCFYLARGSKRDYLYILLALLLDVVIFFTYSRMALFCSVLISVIYFFVVLKSSCHKKSLIIALCSLLAVGVVLVICFWQQVINITNYYIKLGFSQNGRASLWEYVAGQFVKNPVFGIGFITKDIYILANVVPGMSNLGGWTLVNAHNVLLHFLACTGIVGALLNLPFYIKKYTMVFTKFNDFKFFTLINYIFIFISSCFDPSPNMDIFFIVILIMFYALVEIDNQTEEQINKSKTITTSKNTIVLSKTDSQQTNLSQKDIIIKNILLSRAEQKLKVKFVQDTK